MRVTTSRNTSSRTNNKCSRNDSNARASKNSCSPQHLLRPDRRSQQRRQVRLQDRPARIDGPDALYEGANRDDVPGFVLGLMGREDTSVEIVDRTGQLPGEHHRRLLAVEDLRKLHRDHLARQGFLFGPRGGAECTRSARSHATPRPARRAPGAREARASSRSPRSSTGHGSTSGSAAGATAASHRTGKSTRAGPSTPCRLARGHPRFPLGPSAFRDDRGSVSLPPVAHDPFAARYDGRSALGCTAGMGRTGGPGRPRSSGRPQNQSTEPSDQRRAPDAAQRAGRAPQSRPDRPLGRGEHDFPRGNDLRAAGPVRHGPHGRARHAARPDGRDGLRRHARGAGCDLSQRLHQPGVHVIRARSRAIGPAAGLVGAHRPTGDAARGARPDRPDPPPKRRRRRAGATNARRPHTVPSSSRSPANSSLRRIR